jgi:hypothetical protein
VLGGLQRASIVADSNLQSSEVLLGMLMTKGSVDLGFMITSEPAQSEFPLPFDTFTPTDS